MEIKDGGLTNEEFDNIASDLRYFHFDTDLTFLKQHNGFRPGCFHGFAGRTSGGKSTLARTLLFDFIRNNPMKLPFVWLSEDNSDLWKYGLLKPDKNLNAELLSIFSEADNYHLFKDSKAGRINFKNIIREVNPSIVFFDNITTSKVFGSSFLDQEEFCFTLKGLFSEMKIPFIYFQHIIESDLKYGLPITLDRVRGSKSIVNNSQYFYMQQDFFPDDGYINTLTVHKSRLHGIANNHFGLNYNPEINQYVSVFPIEREDFLAITKQHRKNIR